MLEGLWNPFVFLAFSQILKAVRKGDVDTYEINAFSLQWRCAVFFARIFSTIIICGRITFSAACNCLSAPCLACSCSRSSDSWMSFSSEMCCNHNFCVFSKNEERCSCLLSPLLRSMSHLIKPSGARDDVIWALDIIHTRHKPWVFPSDDSFVWCSSAFPSRDRPSCSRSFPTSN